jgi:hypothetical protein
MLSAPLAWLRQLIGRGLERTTPLCGDQRLQPCDLAKHLDQQSLQISAR